MVTIIQRVLQTQPEDGSIGITEEEKEALMAEMEKLQNNKDNG